MEYYSGLSASALCGLLLMFLPALASAQSAETSSSPAAEALFMAGRAAMNAGDTVNACAKFRESQRLEPAAGTRLNLAKCEEKLGHLATAWELYQSVARALPATDPRQQLALASAQALNLRMPRVVFKLKPGAPADVILEHDGTQFTSASLGVPIPVDPGDHTVVVRSKHSAPKSLRFTLREGEQRALLIEAGPTQLAAREQARQRQAERALLQARARNFNLGVFSFGLAGSAFAVGALSGIGVLHAKSTADDPAHCDAAGACDSVGLDAIDRGKDLALVSNLAFAVGAVATGAGVYFILSRPERPERSRTGVALALGVRPLGAGAGLFLARQY